MRDFSSEGSGAPRPEIMIVPGLIAALMPSASGHSAQSYND
jgi:hypothetical protein